VRVRKGTGRLPGFALPSSMVESNHDEERLARAEQMIEALQRDTAALKIRTSRLTLWCDTDDRTKAEKPRGSQDRARAAFKALKKKITAR